MIEVDIVFLTCVGSRSAARTDESGEIGVCLVSESKKHMPQSVRSVTSARWSLRTQRKKELYMSQHLGVLTLRKSAWTGWRSNRHHFFCFFTSFKVLDVRVTFIEIISSCKPLLLFYTFLVCYLRILCPRPPNLLLWLSLVSKWACIAREKKHVKRKRDSERMGEK